MKFRQHHYYINKQYKNWFLHYLYQRTSDYGLSMFRWFSTSLVMIIIFAFSFFLLDNISSIRIIELAGDGHWFDYFYYSTVTFTTLGYGDILPYTMWQKMLVSVEVIVGYVMLGLFMTLLSKRI